MQPATGSAQSINLPMSNLWHSDKQGHGQTNLLTYTEGPMKPNMYAWSEFPVIKRLLLKTCLIYGKCEVFRELSWCQSFECSWGLNVLLTLGNRSWPLSPSYRGGQRLCVLMCVGSGHVGTCSYNLYWSFACTQLTKQCIDKRKVTHTHTLNTKSLK